MTELSDSRFNEILNSLMASPLFQLSLASKELFHSNFLAWLCHCYPEQVGRLFSKYLPRLPVAKTLRKVERERKHFDLLISYSDNIQLVIENKVKSLPYVHQLKEYSAAVRNKELTGFLLLSLTRPHFLEVGETAYTLDADVVWNCMSYRELATQLSAIAPYVKSKDDYHSALLDDYITFISLLDDLHSLVLTDWSDEDCDFFGGQERIKRLRQVRLHDLIDKLRFAELAQRVATQLTKDGHEVVMQHLPDGQIGQIAVHSAMTRGVGLFDMKYLLTRCQTNEPLILGVQVQGQAIRLNVEMGQDRERPYKCAKALLNPKHGKRIWFDLDSIPGDSVEYPKNGGLNKFGKKFWYRSKKLGKISPKTLVDTIVNFVSLIDEHRGVLCQQINEFTI